MVRQVFQAYSNSFLQYFVSKKKYFERSVTDVQYIVICKEIIIIIIITVHVLTLF